MAVVQTDDEARALRYVWLGPKEFRAPWDWVGPQWAVAVLVLVLAILPIGIFRPQLPLTAVILTGACVATWYAGGPLTSRLLAADLGPRYWLITLVLEVTGTRPDTTERTETTALPATHLHDAPRSER